MNNWSKLMQMGDVVIEVHGIASERDEHLADEILIREDSFSEDGDSRNRDLSVSSFSSKLCNVIVDPDDVDN